MGVVFLCHFLFYDLSCCCVASGSANIAKSDRHIGFWSQASNRFWKHCKHEGLETVGSLPPFLVSDVTRAIHGQGCTLALSGVLDK